MLFSTSPTVPLHETSLYGMYSRAFDEAGFESKIKQHLPRHILGYLQEKLGLVIRSDVCRICIYYINRVDPNETAKLGWSRGTYFDVYAPALPKTVSTFIIAYHDIFRK